MAMNLLEASRRRWTVVSSGRLPAKAYHELAPRCLKVINQQLWCCGQQASVVVYDRDIQQQRVIQYCGIDSVNDVAEMSSGDVIIASNNGLYHTADTGKTLRRTFV